MLIVQNLGYAHPDKERLFQNLHLSLRPGEKVSLIGPNGSGKSTLLKLIAGELHPLEGTIKTDTSCYYVPQVFGQFNQLSVAEALHIAGPLHALHEILDGRVTEQNLAALNDDWTIEERCREALQKWGLQHLDLRQKMDVLSGGQKTRLFLAGISIHNPGLVIMDEPSNHLDLAARQQLYAFVASASCALLVVSHDRKLLNLLHSTYELSADGITAYGGNYDFYAAQKKVEEQAWQQDIKNKEKALLKAGEKERDTLERQQKLNARGKKKQEKAGLPTIVMNTLRNNAERSTAKLKEVHTEKKGAILQELRELQNARPDTRHIKLGFIDPDLHTGKIWFRATEINHAYHTEVLWKKSLSLQVTGGERIALKGANGSGKTTLIRIILGSLTPRTGSVYHAQMRMVYMDQEYSFINDSLTVYEQAAQYNTEALQEHEINTRLSRFLFTKDQWNKPCKVLSGGERMRLMLCCLSMNSHAPDLVILDEPTNNLDIQNMVVLTEAIRDYKGTLVVVSHDEHFLGGIGITREITLEERAAD